MTFRLSIIGATSAELEEIIALRGKALKWHRKAVAAEAELLTARRESERQPYPEPDPRCQRIKELAYICSQHGLLDDLDTRESDRGRFIWTHGQDAFEKFCSFQDLLAEYLGIEVDQVGAAVRTREDLQELVEWARNQVEAPAMAAG